EVAAGRDRRVLPRLGALGGQGPTHPLDPRRGAGSAARPGAGGHLLSPAGPRGGAPASERGCAWKKTWALVHVQRTTAALSGALRIPGHLLRRRWLDRNGRTVGHVARVAARRGPAGFLRDRFETRGAGRECARAGSRASPPSRAPARRVSLS